MMTTLSGRSVLLIIGGGIAAYKSLELIRLLKQRQAKVTAIMTKAAAEFVTQLSVASLTAEKVYTDLFSLTDEVEMGHIELSRAADLLVVAPASADLMAKMAQGLANDLASTTLLATDKKILIAPAMNVRMWQHPATMRNLATLKGDGVRVVGPNDGEMACGEYGPGRMAEPVEILAAIEAHFAGSAVPLAGATATRPLTGRRVLITAGPTHEPIDPVRYLANRSSGRQGFAIAAALAQLGARVTLVAGPVTLATPPGVDRIDVETAREMASAVGLALPADAAVMVAAVADWRVESAGQKLKKGVVPPVLHLVENPDILATLAKSPDRPRLLIGFAAETEKIIEHASAKRLRKDVDWIIANDVSGDVMGGEANAVHIVTANGVESWERLPKDEVARRLADRIAAALPA